MKYKITIALLILVFSSPVFAQGEKKLSKNFSFIITGGLDTISSFSIEQRVKRSGWGEFNGALTQSLVSKGFHVINNGKSSHSYKIIIDYGRGFYASKMQYFDLRGQIIDVNKNSEVLGTFAYDGRFEPDNIGEAIASRLKEKNPAIIKEEVRIDIPKDEIKSDSKENEITTTTSKPTKSKEDRLIELKNLFDKNLISKEEYERARKKIIEE